MYKEQIIDNINSILSDLDDYHNWDGLVECDEIPWDKLKKEIQPFKEALLNTLAYKAVITANMGDTAHD